jgi:hypothetical protein
MNITSFVASQNSPPLRNIRKQKPHPAEISWTMCSHHFLPVLLVHREPFAAGCIQCTVPRLHWRSHRGESNQRPKRTSDGSLRWTVYRTGKSRESPGLCPKMPEIQFQRRSFIRRPDCSVVLIEPSAIRCAPGENQASSCLHQCRCTRLCRCACK